MKACSDFLKDIFSKKHSVSITRFIRKPDLYMWCDLGEGSVGRKFELKQKKNGALVGKQRLFIEGSDSISFCRPTPKVISQIFKFDFFEYAVFLSQTFIRTFNLNHKNAIFQNSDFDSAHFLQFLNDLPVCCSSLIRQLIVSLYGFFFCTNFVFFDAEQCVAILSTSRRRILRINRLLWNY